MLSGKQKKLLDLFFETKTSAKVLRREKLQDEKYRFYDIIRDTRPIDFPLNDSEFAIKIHEVNPNAPLSPYYINLRNLPEELLNIIAELLADVDIHDRADIVTGIPKTAIDMARKYCQITKIPFVDIFEKTGTDVNRKIQVKGDTPPGNGKKLVIVDDVVSQGRSKFEAIKAAEDAGYDACAILVLIDREQGGTKEMENSGYAVYSVFKISQIMNYYLGTGKITQEQYDNFLNYTVV